VFVTTLRGGKSARISTGSFVPRKSSPKLVRNSVALVQEGPSLSLMACKYTCIKERAIAVVDSMSVHKLLEKGRLGLQGTCHDTPFRERAGRKGPSVSLSACKVTRWKFTVVPSASRLIFSQTCVYLSGLFVALLAAQVMRNERRIIGTLLNNPGKGIRNTSHH